MHIRLKFELLHLCFLWFFGVHSRFVGIYDTGILASRPLLLSTVLLVQDSNYSLYWSTGVPGTVDSE
jgi:hypothetical protein